MHLLHILGKWARLKRAAFIIRPHRDEHSSRSGCFQVNFINSALSQRTACKADASARFDFLTSKKSKLHGRRVRLHRASDRCDLSLMLHSVLNRLLRLDLYVQTDDAATPMQAQVLQKSVSLTWNSWLQRRREENHTICILTRFEISFREALMS